MDSSFCIPQEDFALCVGYRVADPKYVSSDLLVQFITSTNKFNHYILVQEDPDKKVRRVHNHFAGFTSYNTVGTVRANLKKTLSEIDGNSGYGSLRSYKSDWDQTHNFAYACKGTGPHFATEGPKVICTDLSVEQIAKYHSIHWGDCANDSTHAFNETTVVQLSSLDTETPVVKKKKRTKLFMEKLRDEIVEDYPDKLWNVDDDCDFNFLTKKLYKTLGYTVKNLDFIIFNRMMNGLVCGLPKGNSETSADLGRYQERYREARGKR